MVTRLCFPPLMVPRDNGEVNQSKEYRAGWLRYAWDWVRRTKPNDYLQMPGSRTVRLPRDNRRWYYANRPNPAVPEGLGDEDAIKAIWSAAAR
jgi:hypothetical protein